MGKCVAPSCIVVCMHTVCSLFIVTTLCASTQHIGVKANTSANIIVPELCDSRLFREWSKATVRLQVRLQVCEHACSDALYFGGTR